MWLAAEDVRGSSLVCHTCPACPPPCSSLGKDVASFAQGTAAPPTTAHTSCCYNRTAMLTELHLGWICVQDDAHGTFQRPPARMIKKAQHRRFHTPEALRWCKIGYRN